MKNLPRYMIEDVARFIDQYAIFGAGKFGPSDFEHKVVDHNPQKAELHVSEGEVTITCKANGKVAKYPLGVVTQFPGDFAQDLKDGKFDGPPAMASNRGAD